MPVPSARRCAVLAAHGHRVVLCSRHSPAGPAVTVDRASGALTAAVPTLTGPGQAEAVDWVLLATKAYDTASATPWLEHLVGPRTRVAVLQNGIDHVERVRPLLPLGIRIVPALLYFAVELVGPGHTRWSWGTDIVVPGDDPAAEFAQLFAGGELHVVQRKDFDAVAWQKILVNVVTNPITALTGRRMEVFRDGEIDVLAHTLMEEAIAAARAAGVGLTEEHVNQARDVICGLAPDTGTSMLYDRLAGRPTEHQLILGAVARTADANGVPAPAIHALLALLHALPEKVPAA